MLEAWEAAGNGDWATFVKLMGGPSVTRKNCPLKIARQWSDESNRYQEPRGFEIIGITYSNVTLPSRIHQWTVAYKIETNKFSLKTSPLCTHSTHIDTSPMDTPNNDEKIKSSLGF